MAAVKCPTCDRSVEVDDAYRDWTVRCPHCGAEFVPSAVVKATGARRGRDEDDDFDDDDEPYGVPSAAREEALQLVSGPATWLEICGWLGTLLAVGIVSVCVVAAASAANNPNGNGNDEPAAVFVFLGCCVGVIGIPYGLAMAIGARKMRSLSSRGWAMTAAILGVASFSVFGVFGLFQTAFGVWALLTLDKPAVREAFGLPRRRNHN